MCCFSRPIKSVSQTQIFARADADNRQFVVYSMTLQTAEDLAMVLPVPVKSGSGEGDVRFIDLKDYPDFFRHLQMGFEPRSNTLSEITYAGRATGDKKLKVVEVGDFEASFVPTVSDFSRLDERFRLPAGTWDQLPEYRAYGFAVFKLKRGLARVHPMAFSYPRENPARLFFPTVHIHDGKVHKTAKFDHALFCQPGDSEHLALGG